MMTAYGWNRLYNTVDVKLYWLLWDRYFLLTCYLTHTLTEPQPIHSATYSLDLQLLTCLLVHLPTHMVTYSLARWFVHSYTCTFVRWFTHSSIHSISKTHAPFVRSPTILPTHSSTHSIAHSFAHLFIYVSVRPSPTFTIIYSLVRSLTYHPI
jgi:hypothetical protein